MMRIITGRARGTHLLTLEGDNTRPTAERTKEAVFSMLQNEIEGKRVLDLFAGSGQLALEAVSRGASRADLVDASPAACKIIAQNIEKTHSAAFCVCPNLDAMGFLSSAVGTYDLVFLDPPYQLGLLPVVLEKLVQRSLVTPASVIVCESERAEDVFGTHNTLETLYTVRKTVRYGRACVTLLMPKEVK